MTRENIKSKKQISNLIPVLRSQPHDEIAYAVASLIGRLQVRTEMNEKTVTLAEAIQVFTQELQQRIAK